MTDQSMIFIKHGLQGQFPSQKVCNLKNKLSKKKINFLIELEII